MKYILIAGNKGSGKDYLGKLLHDELIERGYKVELDSFANPIKEIISKTLNVTLDELDTFKNQNEPIVVRKNGFQEIVTDFRKVLQIFGTEAMKPIFGDDIWARLLYEKKRDCDYVIVTDFRFMIEQNDKAVTIKVLGGKTGDSHASENDLKDFEFDIVVDNTDKKDLSIEINNCLKMII